MARQTANLNGLSSQRALDGENLTESTASLLRRLIEMGELGDPIPPERHIADLIGVSRVTVRRAMDILEADDVIRRVHGRGTFAESGPLLISPAQLQRRKEPTFLVLVQQNEPKLTPQHAPIRYRVCQQLLQDFESRGIDLCFMQSDHFFRMLANEQLPTDIVRGCFSPSHTWSADQYEAAMRSDVPWVGLGRTSMAMYWNIIDIDSESALRNAIEWLEPRTDDRVFLAVDPYPQEVSAQRWLETAIDQLAIHGIGPDRVVTHAEGRIESDGYLATRWYMREHGLPTLVLTDFDLTAVGAYRAIRTFHEESDDPLITRRTRMLGAWDLDICRFLSPPLPSLAVDHRQLAERVLDMIEHQQRTHTPARLSIVKTTFAPRH